LTRIPLASGTILRVCYDLLRTHARFVLTLQAFSFMLLASIRSHVVHTDLHTPSMPRHSLSSQIGISSGHFLSLSCSSSPIGSSITSELSMAICSRLVAWSMQTSYVAAHTMLATCLVMSAATPAKTGSLRALS
jgi:hypothetical protein